MSTLMFLLSYLEEYRVQKYQTGIELSFYDNILTGGSGVSACDETYCDNQSIINVVITIDKKTERQASVCQNFPLSYCLRLYFSLLEAILQLAVKYFHQHFKRSCEIRSVAANREHDYGNT